MPRRIVADDAAFPNAAKAYGRGEMSQKAWDHLAKQPLFQVWIRGVLRRHFEKAPAEERETWPKP